MPCFVLMHLKMLSFFFLPKLKTCYISPIRMNHISENLTNHGSGNKIPREKDSFYRQERLSSSMAAPHYSSCFACALVFFAVFTSVLVVSHQEQAQLVLDSAEQEAVYKVLESINPGIPWRSLFPDDLCSSAPHGVVCDYFGPNGSTSAEPEAVHIIELSFGYVSDYNPNPPCSPNSTLNPLIFTSFRYLRKLFFYKCFTRTEAPVPETSVVTSYGFGSDLEELVLIDNPALVGPVSTIIGNFTNLRRLIVSGNGFYGRIPDTISDLASLQEITLSRNNLSGELPFDWTPLRKTLTILDMSHNYFEGNVPDSIGSLSRLLKLDLSSNSLRGRIPDSFGELQNLEFLDLSFNRFGNFGVPLFLSTMTRLREVHLSGNKLEGRIPEIWRDMKDVSGIGFSSMGLVGSIPASMGVYLRNLSYLALDNNMLHGRVPEEFNLLKRVGEINLANNNLSGRVGLSETFRGRMGKKLKLGGNPNLCIDDGSGGDFSGGLRQMKLCSEGQNPNPALLMGSSSSPSPGSPLLLQQRSWHVSLVILGLVLGGGFWVG